MILGNYNFLFIKTLKFIKKKKKILKSKVLFRKKKKNFELNFVIEVFEM